VVGDDQIGFAAPADDGVELARHPPKRWQLSPMTRRPACKPLTPPRWTCRPSPWHAQPLGWHRSGLQSIRLVVSHRGPPRFSTQSITCRDRSVARNVIEHGKTAALEPIALVLALPSAWSYRLLSHAAPGPKAPDNVDYDKRNIGVLGAGTKPLTSARCAGRRQNGRARPGKSRSPSDEDQPPVVQCQLEP
jgi:hypothetical protein